MSRGFMLLAYMGYRKSLHDYLLHWKNNIYWSSPFYPLNSSPKPHQTDYQKLYRIRFCENNKYKSCQNISKGTTKKLFLTTKSPVSSAYENLREWCTFSNVPNTPLELCEGNNDFAPKSICAGNWKRTENQYSGKNISCKQLLYLWLTEPGSQGRCTKYLWGRQFGIKCIILLDIRNADTTDSFWFWITFFSKPSFLINPFCSTFCPTDKEMSLITSPLGFPSWRSSLKLFSWLT